VAGTLLLAARACGCAEELDAGKLASLIEQALRE
jgi:hypothetical protein